MMRLEEFRIYYNHTIHPELQRLERRRIRLLRLLFFSALLFFGVLLFTLYINVWVLVLLISIPMAVYISYLIYRIRRFVHTFKPHVINLILEFMNENPNYSNLAYDSNGFISKSRFSDSGIFETKGQYYQGEDQIKGMIGEMPFELCELSVREISPVGSKLDEVFSGIFLYAVFGEEDTEGHIIIWPRRRRPYLTRSIKAFTWEGGENVDHEILNDQFRENFIVYATKETHVVGILSEPMQEALLTYTQRTGKDIYIAFQDREIYAAITEDRDLLEPFIFYSNLSFDLVREFYEDIELALQIVRDFDQTH